VRKRKSKPSDYILKIHKFHNESVNLSNEIANLKAQQAYLETSLKALEAKHTINYYEWEKYEKLHN
jgi:hypothetical protein